MPNESAMVVRGVWLSLHLHFDDASVYGSAADTVVRSSVGRLVTHLRERGLLRHFFFVRYGERGSHIRVRLRSAHDEFAPVVLAKIDEIVAGSRLAPGPVGDRHDGTPVPITRVEFVRYEPEVDRYGGADAVAIAETLFCASSDAAMAMLGSASPPRAERLGKALLANLSILHAFVPTRRAAAALSAAYATGYLGSVAPAATHENWRRRFESGYDRQAEALEAYVEEGIERLTAAESLTETLAPLAVALPTCRTELMRLSRAGAVVAFGRRLSWEEAVHRIVPSYMHMMANRLGVTVPEETYLAHILTRALSRLSAALI
jgi:thiopeptide-type bacteriocin biosynthesis protein